MPPCARKLSDGDSLENFLRQAADELDVPQHKRVVLGWIA